MLSTLFINKAVAIFVGPQGIALIGQFQNFSQIAMISSQGAINNGVVKYVSEYGEDNPKLYLLLSTSFKVTIFFSLITGILITVFSKIEANYFLKNGNYYYIFIIFGLTILFFALNSLILSVLNGLQQVSYYFKINILQSVVTLIITMCLIKFLGIQGVLIALVVNQSIIFLLLLILLRGHKFLNVNILKHPFDKIETKKLLKFSLMAIVSSVITPFSYIIIRNNIQKELGIVAAGQWQALWYISTMHLFLITTTLSVYYLPKLSSINNKKILKLEILNVYKFVIPIVLLTSFFLFELRDTLIELFFSIEFYKIKDLLFFQLIGDIFKILSWVLSYLMIAKAMVKIFILTEFIFVSSFVFLAFIFVNRFGLEGISYAYALNYLLYFISMIFVFRRILF